MARQTTEEESKLMRQTRRRLIGAVALVLLVVFLLPMVFDSEPSPGVGNNIELRIPNKDSAPEFQPKINLPELDKMASAVATTSEVANVQAVSTPALTLSAPAQPASAVVANPPRSRPAPVAQPLAAESEPKTVARPAPRPTSKPVARAKAVPRSGWVLQIGAYANAETANNLRTRLAHQGYHVYTEQAGKVVRVRIGAYPTRESAEKVQARLQAQGTHANVVNLE